MALYRLYNVYTRYQTHFNPLSVYESLEVDSVVMFKLTTFELLCLISRANKKVKVSNENLTFAKIINSQYNSLTTVFVCFRCEEDGQWR
jgi:hypothetical protein